jgi:hypothetical protein
MTDFNQATEMILAVSSLLKDLQEQLESGKEFPTDEAENINKYQVFMSQLILLQREMEDFIENAVTLELSVQELPVQILDFSSEWERFK